MTNRLNNIISSIESEHFATSTGNTIHAKLQFVKTGEQETGDKDLISKINSSNNELKDFFKEDSQTEVPVAGFINGHFISRRIDRIVIDKATKTIRILDYKTDTNPNTFRTKYIAQLHEYANLLKQIYPTYNVYTYILWLHTWTLEHII